MYAYAYIEQPTFSKSFLASTTCFNSFFWEDWPGGGGKSQISASF